VIEAASERLEVKAAPSTSCMTGAGLKKCSPATRSGFLTPAAMAVIEIDEVLRPGDVCGSGGAAVPVRERLGETAGSLPLDARLYR
jgi:hypothetical protein